MPQFDFTTYSSQIFWFAICFIILYTFVSLTITPRLKAIIEQRKKIINDDLQISQKLEAKIQEIRSSINKNNQDSSNIYHNQINLTVEEIKKNREEKIANLKKNIEESAKKSRLQLQDFINESQIKSIEVVDQLVKNIKSKIIN